MEKLLNILAAIITIATFIFSILRTEPSLSIQIDHLQLSSTPLKFVILVFMHIVYGFGLGVFSFNVLFYLFFSLLVSWASVFTIDFVAGPLMRFLSAPDQLRVPMFQIFIASTIICVPAMIMGGIAYMHNEIEWGNVLAGVEEDKVLIFPISSLAVTQLIMLGAYYDFKVLPFTIFSLGKG